ncbi:MAG: glycosyltransferase [Clostridiales bacterium]|nr:glycosyltransferase [Clostridiales bacterium]
MSEKLKIAELLDSYFPCIDGPINVVTYYSEHLNKQADCKLIVPKAKKKQKYVDNRPFEVIRCKSTAAPEGYRLGHPGSDKKLKKRVKQEQFDIFHTHSPFSMGTFAVKMGKKYHVPVVATLHTKYYDDFSRVLHGFKPLCNFMLRRIMRVYKAADSVWTVNNASCQVLRDYGYKGDIVVMRNGTDLKYPDNAEELVARVNALHNLEGQKNVLIFVGRIAMYKNLALMAEALRKLKDAGEDFKMLIVGSGFDEGKFKSMVEKLGLSENFVFVGSVRDRELLQGYYLRSDLFLFPSTFDTSSLVPIEAAAHKLPTLLIKDSCTAENIVDGVNGFLAEETADAYAEKIKEILSDPEKLHAVGEEAHRSVYRTWETVAEEVLEKYKEIIEDYKKKQK